MTDLFAEMREKVEMSAYVADLTPAKFNGSPDAQDTPLTEDMLRYDESFIRNAKKVYKLMQGSDFTGDDDEAHRYGINIIGEFQWNFANPVAGDVAGVEVRPGTLRQAAELMASGSRDNARAWVYLFDQYERLPNFTASGSWRAIRGILSDPTTWGALFTAGGSKAAAMLGQKGIAAGIRSLATKIAEHPVKAGAVAGAAYTGAPSATEQMAQEKAGFERPIEERAADVALEAGIGALGGAGLAKAIEVAPGLIQKAGDVLDKNMSLTDEERDVINMVSPEAQ